MESSQENSTNSLNNTEIGELLEEKGQDSLQANFQFSSVEIKENTIKKEPINKILIVEEKKTTEPKIRNKNLAEIFEAIEEGFSSSKPENEYAFPHPRYWVGPRFMSLWVLPIYLLRIIKDFLNSSNPIRPYKEIDFSIGNSETIYTSTKKAFESSSSMRFFGVRFLSIWVIPFAITGIFMEYLFVSPLTGNQPFG